MQDLLNLLSLIQTYRSKPNGTSDSARIADANSILDRGCGCGKPKSDGVEEIELPTIVIQRAE